MDLFHYEGYGSFSDPSAPRTPSPQSDEYPLSFAPHFAKTSIDLDPSSVRIYSEAPTEDGYVPEAHVSDGSGIWGGMGQGGQHQFYASNNSSRGSLLQELYDPDQQHSTPPHEVYMEQSASPPFSGDSWPQEHVVPSPQLQHHSAPRRATFPYVRHDRAEHQNFQQPPAYIAENAHMLNGYGRHDALYGEPMPMDRSPHLPLAAEPSALHGEPYMHSPHAHYHELHRADEPHVKLEDSMPVIVPSQTPYYQASPDHSCLNVPMSFMTQHTGVPVQHTDDAASKETQYLRRRCFNCHTTEPPSWRRSTLNPGKIVCNKCGLYERTHLRPRPLRFDELRAGNKSRKASKVVGGSPKVKPASLVKKEPREYGLVRRGSVSSNSSNSGSATSDWDDNVSVYSSGSAPPSSYNSPSMPSFSIPTDPNGESPPSDGGIRLPNAPLNDIASLQSSPQQRPATAPSGSPPTPRKSATAPGPYYNPYPSANGDVFRRASLPDRRHSELDVSETGWQPVPKSELKDSPGRPRSDSTPAALPTAVAT